MESVFYKKYLEGDGQQGERNGSSQVRRKWMQNCIERRGREHDKTPHRMKGRNKVPASNSLTSRELTYVCKSNSAHIKELNNACQMLIHTHAHAFACTIWYQNAEYRTTDTWRAVLGFLCDCRILALCHIQACFKQCACTLQLICVIVHTHTWLS